jgi:hypothetical protein
LLDLADAQARYQVAWAHAHGVCPEHPFLGPDLAAAGCAHPEPAGGWTAEAKSRREEVSTLRREYERTWQATTQAARRLPSLA